MTSTLPRPATTQDRPYLGVFIAACLLQRGQAIKDVALSLARQGAIFMIQHMQSYALKPEVEVIVEQKKFNDRQDPMVVFECFNRVHTGLQPNLLESRKSLGLHKTNDGKILPATRSKQEIVFVILDETCQTSDDYRKEIITCTEAWVNAYLQRLRNDLSNLNYYEVCYNYASHTDVSHSRC